MTERAVAKSKPRRASAARSLLAASGALPGLAPRAKPATFGRHQSGGLFVTGISHGQLARQFARDAFRRQPSSDRAARLPFPSQRRCPRLGEAPVVDQPRRDTARDHGVECGRVKCIGSSP